MLIIHHILIIATLAAFVLLLARKWGIIEWLQIHGSELVAKLAGCDFCLSFWTCVCIAFVAAVLARDIAYIWTPFLCAPLTRRLL